MRVSERLGVESEIGATSVAPIVETDECAPEHGESFLSVGLPSAEHPQPSPLMLVLLYHHPTQDLTHQTMWALNVPQKVKPMVEAHPWVHWCLHLVINRSWSIWISLHVCVGH
jgi:hypothetical protein